MAVGVVASVPLVSPVAAAAATPTVTTTRDGLVVHDRRCSLREAIEAVESPGTRTGCGRASRGSNTIVLGLGRYGLLIPRAGVDDNTSGDLNVRGAAPLTITGAGPRTTVIDAGGLGDRVLSVASGARLVLGRLSITGGRAPAGSAGASGVAGVGCAAGGAGAVGVDAGASGDGGGISNAGTLVLNTVAVTGNTAGAGGAGGNGSGTGCNGGNGGLGGGGGGVYNQGRLTLIDSSVSRNRAGAGGGGGSGDADPLEASGAGGSGGPGGSGGGLDNHGTLSVTASTLGRNSAGAGGSAAGEVPAQDRSVPTAAAAWAARGAASSVEPGCWR
jgi:CSLREA domain-containing protein